jgi:hypothetical protein
VLPGEPGNVRQLHSNKCWSDSVARAIVTAELFIRSSVIFSMAQNPPRRKKNELRDALLVSLALAVTLFSLAMVASAHL